MILKVTLESPEEYWLMDGIKSIVVTTVTTVGFVIGDQTFDLRQGLKEDTEYVNTRLLKCFDETKEIKFIYVNTDCYLMSDEGRTIEKITT